MADFPIRTLLSAWQGAVAQLTTVQAQLDHLVALDPMSWPRPHRVEVSVRLMQMSAQHALEALALVPTPCLEVVAEVWRTLEEAHVEAEAPHTPEGRA
jgi:hypothetical protein